MARGKILSKLKEELAWHGIAYKEVEPAFTSQVCPNCHNLDGDNREGKSFNCTVCNYKEDADYVASLNIKDRAFNQDIKSIKSSDIESLKMNERNIKIPKRCKGE